MRSVLVAWACLLIVAFAPATAGATVTAEHFNYGPVETPLMGLNGGENWGGAWAGYDQLSPKYAPAAGLSYAGPCYFNGEWEGHEGNDPLQGGTVHQSYRGSPRPLPDVLTGTVWTSNLVRLGSNDSFRGFFFGNEALTFWYGFNADCRLYVTFDGCGTDEGTTVFSESETHLVVAKLEINYDVDGHDRISVWADPVDVCNGEDALGAPEAVMDGCDITPGWDVLMFDLGNGSNVDAIRISHGADSCLDEVMYWVLYTPVETASWTELKALFR